MSVNLKTTRFLNNMSQAKLCRITGIHQSKLSLAENGLTTLSGEEKMKIVSVLGGHIDWNATENSDDGDYDMKPRSPYPSQREAINHELAKKGLKIIYSDDPDNLIAPKVVPLTDKEDG